MSDFVKYKQEEIDLDATNNVNYIQITLSTQSFFRIRFPCRFIVFSVSFLHEHIARELLSFGRSLLISRDMSESSL